MRYRGQSTPPTTPVATASAVLVEALAGLEALAAACPATQLALAESDGEFEWAPVAAALRQRLPRRMAARFLPELDRVSTAVTAIAGSHAADVADAEIAMSALLQVCLALLVCNDLTSLQCRIFTCSHISVKPPSSRAKIIQSTGVRAFGRARMRIVFICASICASKPKLLLGCATWPREQQLIHFPVGRVCEKFKSVARVSQKCRKRCANVREASKALREPFRY